MSVLKVLRLGPAAIAPDLVADEGAAPGSTEGALAPPERPTFEALVTAEREALLGRARQLCRSHQDPEDLVHDVLERAFVRFETLRDGRRARAWLFTLLTNTFIDRVRKQRATPPSAPIDDLSLAAPVETPRPVWADITMADLLAAVDLLPEDLRRVYRLHALQGVDYEQVAISLGIAKNTVGTRLLRARQKLRAILARKMALIDDATEPAITGARP
jgi:RNA polymerase sigma-70 factor (ECF subfamily)